MKYLLIIFITILTLGCKRQTNMTKESPLISVIKLQAAESIMNLDEAEKYIDVEKVFEKYPDSNNPREEWKEMLTFLYNIGNTKKFTNQFKYYNYTVVEEIGESTATVNFIALNTDANIKEIVYTLVIVNDMWKVVGIDYRS
ncbi:hypothetical protein [Spongiimicrobium sp. 3-5]|uniref:hypothetical protein n=1 Tax=Spongiimicrobium sp. 3-5 TaxID=3332596 RepID=UPI0039811350